MSQFRRDMWVRNGLSALQQMSFYKWETSLNFRWIFTEISQGRLSMEIASWRICVSFNCACHTCQVRRYFTPYYRGLTWNRNSGREKKTKVSRCSLPNIDVDAFSALNFFNFYCGRHNKYFLRKNHILKWPTLMIKIIDRICVVVWQLTRDSLRLGRFSSTTHPHPVRSFQSRKLRPNSQQYYERDRSFISCRQAIHTQPADVGTTLESDGARKFRGNFAEGVEL